MNSPGACRVLVLDGDMVPALTISRSLSRRGCQVDTASNDHRPIAGHSNCVDQVFQYPDPLTEEPDFLDWLAEHTRSAQYDLVIPVTERSLVPISRRRECFEHVRIAMPSADSLEVALDKEQTMALASRVGVPVPSTITISSLDELEEKLPKSFPVVLKPARSLGTNDHGSSQLKVSYAFDESGLRSGCEHALKFGPVLLQEYFRGRGVGIELIARKGEVAYAFQHLRLHEVPLTGGGSSLRRSQPVEPCLLDAATRLMAALKWNGVAMVEFKWNEETQAFCLMEINGRFWGSLPLAHVAGADFPSMLLDLELMDEIFPCDEYDPDVYCRKLSSDCYWYEAVLRDEGKSQIVDIPDGRAVVRELGLFFSRKHYFDVQSWRDPIPGLVDIGHILSSYYRRFIAIIEEKVFFWRQRRAWRRGDVAKSLLAADSILFICYGNINRSALADVLINEYAEDSGMNVISAGFHQEPGRPADPVMVEVSRAHGVDLGMSRSTTLTRKLLAASDVIFAMEKRHIDQLLELDPLAAEKSWLLGAHGGHNSGNPEIGDPYGGPRDGYELCFKRISEAVDNVKSVLAFSPRED